MKEKLIQIVEEYDYEEGTPRDQVREFFASVRCDTCAHWDHFEESVPAGSCDELDRLTTPDFFCARWEAR